VTSEGYTRYTLRLPGAAAGSYDPGAGRPEDDWSGAAAFAMHHQPLDYAHPEAVALVASLEPTGWQEEDDGDTLVFWLQGEAEDAEAADVLGRLAELGTLEAAPEREGWEDAWRRFHRPQVVGRLYVRPPWYPPREDLLDVVIDAGQAFGTGGHATTRQCLEEIQGMSPESFLDLGCGSGVVSLAALRLGFGPVWGMDVDPAAVRAAEENAARNGLEPTFSAGDVTDPACDLPAAATVVANIALGPILRLAPRLATGAGARHVQAPDHLLLAGLLEEQASEAAAAFPAYREVRRRGDGEWALVHLERRP
jgi:ribosomal protein L11 methyltransferase